MVPLKLYKIKSVSNVNTSGSYSSIYEINANIYVEGDAGQLLIQVWNKEHGLGTYPSKSHILQHSYDNIKLHRQEMAQWLKPPDILVENKSSIPRTNYFFEKKKTTTATKPTNNQTKQLCDIQGKQNQTNAVIKPHRCHKIR